eukprot:1161127-Pelagomonas_calceolata.AAC.11
MAIVPASVHSVAFQSQARVRPPPYWSNGSDSKRQEEEMRAALAARIAASKAPQVGSKGAASAVTMQKGFPSEAKKITEMGPLGCSREFVALNLKPARLGARAKFAVA